MKLQNISFGFLLFCAGEIFTTGRQYSVWKIKFTAFSRTLVIKRKRKKQNKTGKATPESQSAINTCCNVSRSVSNTLAGRSPPARTQIHQEEEREDALRLQRIYITTYVIELNYSWLTALVIYFWMIVICRSKNLHSFIQTLCTCIYMLNDALAC